MRVNNTVLSIAIAQTQTEQTINPSITVLTSQWACQNRWNSDRSEDVNGNADGTMSAGFMGASFPRSGLAQAATLDMSGATPARRLMGRWAARQHARRPDPKISRGPKPDPPPAGPEIIAKLVQTRAQPPGRSRLTKPCYR